MISDITIGQYYPQESVIHRLDPRVKLMGVLLYIISLFCIRNPLIYLLSLVFVIVLFRMAKIPFAAFLSGLKGVIFLLVFTLVFRMLYTPGTVVWQYGIFSITQEGIDKSISMTARIALMIIGASLLSYTATPKEMANGLEKAFGFLEKFGVPVHDMSVITMIAFRFIPIMMEELNLLMDAQAARGAKFEDGNVFEKCRNVCTLLLPLFLSTVRRASDLAMAMEARGYTGAPETGKLHPLIYKRYDYIGYGVMILYLVVIICLRFFVVY